MPEMGQKPTINFSITASHRYAVKGPNIKAHNVTSPPQPSTSDSRCGCAGRVGLGFKVQGLGVQGLGAFDLGLYALNKKMSHQPYIGSRNSYTGI